MSDLGGMSNEELMQALGQGGSTPAAAPAAASPFAGMSDDELLQALGRDKPAPSDGVTGTLAAYGEGAGSGIPVIGPYVDKATDVYIAGMQSLLKGSKYDDELKSLKDRQAGLKERHSTADALGQLSGGVAGTVPMVMAAPAAFGAGAGGMVSRALLGGASGGAIGAADQGVRAYDEGRDVGDAASSGAKFGLAAGAAGPFAGRAIGSGVSFVGDRLMGPGSAFGDLSRKAVKYAQETVLDPAKRQAMQTQLQRLGPDAMLADVSPEWFGVARGAATRPGARDAVVNPLTARGDAKNIRLGNDLDASLGRVQSPRSVLEAIEGNQARVGERYGPIIDQAAPVDTSNLAGALDASQSLLRGPAQRSAGQVRGMLNEVGGDALDTNAATLHQTRQAIDGLLTDETNPSVIRQLTMARRQVDDELASAAPGIKAVDADHAELSRQAQGLQTGSQVFDSGKTAARPDDFATDFRASALPQGEQIGPSGVPLRMQQGARAEMDRVVGQNSNDPAAMQRLLRGEGDWNRDKLATLYGPDRANRALGAIDRETAFYRTQNKVTGGSDTAVSQRFGDFLDAMEKPTAVPNDLSILGAVMRGGQKVIGAASESRAIAKGAKFSDELGRMSVAQGAERDQLVTSLIEALERSSGTRKAGEISGLLAALATRSAGLQGPSTIPSR